MTEATTRPLTGAWYQDPNDNRIHDAAGNDVLDYLPVTEIGKRVNAHDALVAALEAVEFAAGFPINDTCPACGALEKNSHRVERGHERHCQLAAALTLARGVTNEALQ
jgi:hypothetical protein